jgi:hypothetical protein
MELFEKVKEMYFSLAETANAQGWGFIFFLIHCCGTFFLFYYVAYIFLCLVQLENPFSKENSIFNKKNWS